MPGMDVQLNEHEARVLGVLIEKALTTPDQYPLTLNATTNGCNQKSNRSPVTDYSEAEVVVAFQGLQMKHLCGGSVPAGSRVEKWHHNVAEHMKLSPDRQAVLAELLLRGPQAPGELRTRASRMARIPGLDELGKVLADLQERGLVRRLPPAPGSRAERYAQLLHGGSPEASGSHGAAPEGATASATAQQAYPSPPSATPSAGASPAEPRPAETGMGMRVAKLEEEVRTLRHQLQDLARKLGEEL